ncbi:MAG: hypothetical protein CSYNP_04401 [Syntrophus sp. SKADARSKE-3]|nr:hypothetical protein [Syntrophus sp. SKADARSKE-3]
MEFFRNHGRIGAIDDLVARTSRQRFEVKPDVSEVLLVTDFFLKPAFNFDLLLNRFPVNDSRFADVHMGVELPRQAVDENFQVQLPHTRNDRLGGLVLVLEFEGRIFLHEFRQGKRQLFLICRRLGFYRLTDNRFIKIYRFKENRALFITERVSCRSVLEPHDADDVSGTGPFDSFPLVGMHLEKSRNLFLLFLARVIDVLANLQLS